MQYCILFYYWIISYCVCIPQFFIYPFICWWAYWWLWSIWLLQMSKCAEIFESLFCCCFGTIPGSAQVIFLALCSETISGHSQGTTYGAKDKMWVVLMRKPYLLCISQYYFSSSDYLFLIIEYTFQRRTAGTYKHFIFNLCVHGAWNWIQGLTCKGWTLPLNYLNGTSMFN